MTQDPMTPDPGFVRWLDNASDELRSIAGVISAGALHGLIDELLGARRIALHALGREGLMMRALTMRLFHLGLQASQVGEMTTPALETGDLLVVAAGPGALESTASLMRIAHAAGARTVLLTAEPAAPLRSHADLVLLMPARTMARASSDPSAFTMGSAFEGMLFMLSEYLVGLLAQRLGETEDAMRARHTNLE
nr:SIS domain-containing protein [uncultured Lichenicoccus sp.]